MYQFHLNRLVDKIIATETEKLPFTNNIDNDFRLRLITNMSELESLFYQLYGKYPNSGTHFENLLETVVAAALKRPADMQLSDAVKTQQDGWFLSNNMVGMSLYADRFAGGLKALPEKLDYLDKLGVNLLHIMPVFESPHSESDGGYAVSNYRKVDSKFGTQEDLINLRKKMADKQMYLMLDIVFNHTSRQHAWAKAALAGDKTYQDYFYMYDNREIPDAFEKAMPEVFPEIAPGNFTYLPEINKWVLNVFHDYQWDLNFTNPKVLIEMLDVVLWMANLGVDVLRIDAPAFIWKIVGTNCQNLPEAHVLLQLVRMCVQVAAPGMALLAEAIVQPAEIMKYFGQGPYFGQECELAYNATLMALQWDALATKNVRIMRHSQPELQKKPIGATWISYTRCHDDIGLGYADSYIKQAGYQPYYHRNFLKNYYIGKNGSPARGALFGSNPKSGDARISGSLASLCGLEYALEKKDELEIKKAIDKIVLMQAMSFFAGGLPMIFYGDEVGYTNDYSYLKDPGKSYDNRWMHRPNIDWKKNAKAFVKGAVENRVFTATAKLIAIRKAIDVFTDRSNIYWIDTGNDQVAGFVRHNENKKVVCLFNFNDAGSYVRWSALFGHDAYTHPLTDHWLDKKLKAEGEFYIMDAYAIAVLEQE